MISPKISIIVPVFNKAAFIRASITSALQQTLPAHEVICVDDASTDGSSEVLAELADEHATVSMIRFQENAGAGAARNAGLDRAAGDYLLFLDADDLLPSFALEVLWRLCSDSGAELVRGSQTYWTAAGGYWQDEFQKMPNVASTTLLGEPKLWLPWGFTCFLFPAEFLRRNDLRFPQLSDGEDPVFLARCLARARGVALTSQVTYTYNLDGAGASPRNTHAHVRDFVRHAGLVKEIYCSTGHGVCWDQGCRKFYRACALGMMQSVPMDGHQKSALLAEISAIWPARPERKHG